MRPSIPRTATAAPAGGDSTASGPSIPRTATAAPAGGDSTASGPVDSPDRDRRAGWRGFHRLRAGRFPGPRPPHPLAGMPGALRARQLQPRNVAKSAAAAVWHANVVLGLHTERRPPAKHCPSVQPGQYSRPASRRPTVRRVLESLRPVVEKATSATPRLRTWPSSAPRSRLRTCRP
jgi:hypothetical protein